LDKQPTPTQPVYQKQILRQNIRQLKVGLPQHVNVLRVLVRGLRDIHVNNTGACESRVGWALVLLIGFYYGEGQAR